MPYYNSKKANNKTRPHFFAILNLADNQKEEAARQLVQSQKLLEEPEKQLADMKRCRQEYAAQLHAKSSVRKNASELQGIRRFIQQLDVAIQQLVQQLLERTLASEQQKEHWMKLRHKTQALSEIKVRYQKSEQQIIEHREQFDVDELSQRKGD